MKTFRSSGEIIDHAIRQEEVSTEFYRSLAGRMEKPWVREMFEALASEEERHRQKLIDLKAGRLDSLPTGMVIDLGIAGTVEVQGVSAEMDFQETLKLAMKREQAAFEMYLRLARVSTDPDVKTLLEGLAHEEATHRLRLESEYDDHVLTQG